MVGQVVFHFNRNEKIIRKIFIDTIMDEFLEEMLTIDTNFILKFEKIRDERNHVITNRLSNSLIFEKIREELNLNYTLSKSHTYNYYGNNTIYLRQREDYKNSKEYRSFTFFSKCKIRSALESCEKFFIFPIITQSDDGAHFVFMLYLKNEKKFYLFDSSGYLEDEEYFHDDLYYLFEEFIIIRECYKLQELSDHYSDTFLLEEILGFCLSWGSLLIYCYIKFNEEISHLEIVNRILSFCNFSRDKMKKLVGNFTKFMVNDHSITSSISSISFSSSLSYPLIHDSSIE